MEPEKEPLENPPESFQPAEAIGDDRTWALAAHLSFLVTFVGVGIGLSWLAPLVIWLIKREESPFVEDQAREALNFQLSVWIVTVVSGITICLLPVSIVAVIGGAVYSVIAAMESNKGELYQYPYTFRLIKK